MFRTVVLGTRRSIFTLCLFIYLTWEGLLGICCTEIFLNGLEFTMDLAFKFISCGPYGSFCLFLARGLGLEIILLSIDPHSIHSLIH